MTADTAKRLGIWTTAAAFLWVGCLSGEVSAQETSDTERDTVQALAERIDKHIKRRWHEEGVTPAPRADDAEFMRRVSLDIAGRIPSVAEARRFLADDAPDKRRRLVDRLLKGPGYITHFTDFWRSVLLPEADVNFRRRYLLPGFEAWLRERLRDDVAYDRFVDELLTASVSGGRATPRAFYEAKEIKPENLAAATSRMFLGVRIECAQCHDHPFDDWKRREFWQYATFFAGLERRRPQRDGVLGSLRELFSRRSLRIPDTGQVVKASYLNGERPQLGLGRSPREALAEWITDAENPYFVRTAVNRLWGHFFGVGIVDPVDDFSSLNPPSHPQLLDELAESFVEHDFDMKFLIRALTASRTYQLTSAQTDPGQDDPRLFARRAVKGLTAEQLFDSIARATGYHQEFDPRAGARFNRNSPKRRFLQLFADASHGPTKRPTTVLQALALMNGQYVGEATSLEESRTLAAVADYPGLTDAERVETLFLATLSRQPRPEERKRFVNYVASGGPRDDPRRALADVFWVLLNSSEFMVNH